ncbi:hypothetical protein AB0J38_08620 [Streptomyces sp. NPDC050095]|uniref:hypothetical protein n=1 Tax=unclassified Streptomyces TaxID=2593676 RepID=UPI00343DC4E5
MSDAGSGGTPAEGDVDFDAIGRTLVFALLSPGAGDGPDQTLTRDLGHYFGQSLGLVVDLMVQAKVGATPEETLRLVLGLSAQEFPTAADLASAAGAVLALAVRENAGTLVEIAEEDLEGGDPGEAALDKDDRAALQQAGIAAPVAVPGASWTLANAIKWLDACLGEADIEPWRKRFAWATAFSAASLAAEVLPMVDEASTSDGNRVHNAIQSRFRTHYGPSAVNPSEILIERTIHRAAGTITLSKARGENARYRRLWLAMRSPRFTRGSLRLDLADLGAMHLWEVKSMPGLAQGVVQIFYYSCAYNCLAAAQGAPERLIPAPLPLAPTVTRPIRLAQSSGGRMRFAFPFEIKELPGLVGYVIIVFPSVKDMQTVAILEMMRRLAKELRRLRGTQAQPSGEIGLSAATVFTIIAAVVLVGAVAAAGPAAVAALAAAAARVAVPVATGTGLLGPRAFGAEPTPGDAPPPGAGPFGQQPITLRTFAGPVVCEDATQLLAVLQALATMMFLGAGPGGGMQ